MRKSTAEWTKKWKEEEGYFTLEASFLVTTAFLLVTVILLSGLYICDLNQAKSYLNQRVVELSLDEKSYESESVLEDRNRLGQQLFVTKIRDFVITKSGRKVKGEVSLSMMINVPIIGDWAGDLWTETFSLAVNAGNNVEMIRRWEQLE